jgi:hypothetical protein
MPGAPIAVSLGVRRHLGGGVFVHNVLEMHDVVETFERVYLILVFRIFHVKLFTVTVRAFHFCLPIIQGYAANIVRAIELPATSDQLASWAVDPGP